MKKYALLSFFVILITGIQAQRTVYAFDAPQNEMVSLRGDLSDGVYIDTLDWAWEAGIACFTSLEYELFTGNHVFFSTLIPEYTEYEIKLIPDDSTANFSLYAYQYGTYNDELPPNLARCIRCEADYKRDRPILGRVQDHTRSVKHILAITRPYKAIIAIVGAEGLTEGGFTLEVTSIYTPRD